MSTTQPDVVWQVFDGADCLAVFRREIDATEFRDYHLEQRRLDQHGQNRAIDDADLLTVRPVPLLLR